MNQTPAFVSTSGVAEDAYLKVIQKQNERERQRRRRGKNNYHFPEEDDDVDDKDGKKKSQYNDFSSDDDDGYSGNKGYSNQQGNNRPDPFANAGGPRKSSKRSDPFGNRYDDDEDYQQPQRSNDQKNRGDPFGGQSQQKSFPQGGSSRRGDPFSRRRGFNDDSDDDD